MAEQTRRNGRKTVSNRLFVENESKTSKAGKSLIALFETFLRAKELEGLRPRTLKEHRATFKYFLSFLKQKYSRVEFADEVTTELIRDYVFYMRKEKRLWDDHTKASCQYKTDKKGLSPFTVNIRLRTLKCFFKFLTDEGYIQANPAARVKLMKTEEYTIQAFSKQQIIDLLKQLNQRTYAGFRDYVLMLLFLDTGIRCNEALGLKKKDFDYEQKIIKVPAPLAKNGHARILPLSKKTAKALNTLIKENSIFENSDFIFLSNYGDEIDLVG
ncbi:tyrosine-type recombinase/integrase [Neobacillus sp. NRS-1170]|uniref:tyrosine-type recombinase/integrase n=1 Tax=Neobacillus sp. NRS-1170 TaxID=3233898 RepID=UPI003D27B4E1